MDSLGDRMKEYERRETDRAFLPTLPVYARIDGRCFSSITRGMARPFDADMIAAMVATTSHLVETTHSRIGYTQSDEISLVWLADGPKSEMFFGGKAQKMASVLAALATAAFTRALLDGPLARYAERLPHFDARVFQLPSQTEAANAFLWREQDATKNAVSMAASHYYSAKDLHGKTGAVKQEMLFAKGVNFNDYPPAFKRGTFVRRVVQERELTAEELIRIPAKHRPPDGQLVTRSAVVALEMPRFGSVTNREALIFDGAEAAIAMALLYFANPGRPDMTRRMTEFSYWLRIVDAVLLLTLNGALIYDAFTGHGTRKQIIGLLIGSVICSAGLAYAALHPPRSAAVPTDHPA